MQIRISYATQIRQHVGASSEILNVDQVSSVEALLKMLCQKHGERLREALLDETGGVRASLIVCVNDEHVLDTGGTKLSDGDDVLIMSAISGG
ncbi:MAG: MoaD/ThiS family protein [Bythopirellula sp.]